MPGLTSEPAVQREPGQGELCHCAHGAGAAGEASGEEGWKYPPHFPAWETETPGGHFTHLPSLSGR